MSIFSEIQLKKPGSSTFDLSHQKKLSGNMGKLIPIFLGDTVPGDKFNISTAQLLRMAPMVAPIMHQVTVYIRTSSSYQIESYGTIGKILLLVVKMV